MFRIQFCFRKFPPIYLETRKGRVTYNLDHMIESLRPRSSQEESPWVPRVEEGGFQPRERVSRQGSWQLAGRQLGRSTARTDAAGEVGTGETKRERKGDREREMRGEREE